jgi:hypothetical protein
VFCLRQWRFPGRTQRHDFELGDDVCQVDPHPMFLLAENRVRAAGIWSEFGRFSALLKNQNGLPTGFWETRTRAKMRDQQCVGVAS